MRTLGGPRPIGRVLVIGAAGFVGRAVVDTLASAGTDVIGADRDIARGRPGTVALDLTVSGQLHDLLATTRPDTILHFAAYGAGDAGLLASAEGDPRKAVAVNVEGFASLLDEAERVGVGRVVWSSSTTVYGPPPTYAPKERVDERAAPAPTSVYGATKLIAERYAAGVVEQTRLSVTGLRLPLVYGPGRWYGGAQTSWLAFAKDVAHGRSGRYAFSVADEDWIYIDDAVASVLAAACAEEPLASVYNVAGSTVSPYEAARRLVELRGSGVEVLPGDDTRKVVLIDGSAFAAATNYLPRVGVGEGVARLARALEIGDVTQ